MNRVKQILDQKGRLIFAIGPDASDYDAIAMMAPFPSRAGIN
jgi:hypothetical protein